MNKRDAEAAGALLAGPRTVLARGEAGYPQAFERLAHPPERLYVVGEADALEEGIAIVGARRSTPYGRGCAQRFAKAAAERGVAVISGGARGCDAAAHTAALEAGGRTVAFLGGGCDQLYPAEHAGLFQRIVDAGGAVASEHDWGAPPLPHQFRLRNRLIASLARATLIVEAGLPSGTFSTADEALAADREVLVVPGAITAPSSRGANRLIYQGAVPIIDDDVFDDALLSLFGCLRQERWAAGGGTGGTGAAEAGSADGAGKVPACGATARAAASLRDDAVVAALRAEPLGMEELYALAAASCGGADARQWLMERLVTAERAGLIARQMDGRWGPAA